MVTELDYPKTLIFHVTLFYALKAYSLSYIVQITDFWDFLREYYEEKSETFTEF